MSKKNWIVILCIIIVGIVVAYIINCSLSNGNLIETKLPLNDWLNFWGGYCGGVFTAIVGYLAIIYSNKNSENAIIQQYKLLQEQDKRKELDEYVNCLKNNLSAINLMELNKFLGSVDYDNIMISISSALDKRVSIYTQDLEFNYVFSKYEAKTELENKYTGYWEQAKNYYIQSLDMYDSLVRRIKEHRIESKLKLNIEQQIRLTQSLSNSSQYSAEILSYQQEITELVNSMNTYRQDIDAYIDSIKKIIDKLKPLFNNLVELSGLLMKEKKHILFNYKDV